MKIKKKFKLFVCVFMIVLVSALPSLSNIKVNALTDTIYFEPPITSGFYYVTLSSNDKQILYIKNDKEISNTDVTIQLYSGDGRNLTFSIDTIDINDSSAYDEVQRQKLNDYFKDGVCEYYTAKNGNCNNIPDYNLDLSGITVYNLDNYFYHNIYRNIYYMTVSYNMTVYQYTIEEYLPNITNLALNIKGFANDMVTNIDTIILPDEFENGINEGILIGKNEAFNNYDSLLPNVLGSVLMFFTSIFGSINFFGISLLAIIGIIGGILLLLFVLKIVRG